MRALPLVPFLCAAALADAPPASFATWVESYAKQGAALHSWWSADLDEDGVPDSIAIVCRPDEGGSAMRGAFLIEAGSKHFVAEFDTLDVTGGPACAPTGTRPPFRRTTDKSLR